jgi:3-isopropylmalate/(R)-2-methylmalate dehydratase small subunit
LGLRAFEVHVGRGVPLERSDVDTDQIVPKQFLRRIERSGYGQFLFFDWMKDESFVLRQPQYAGASILVTGANFGCGSSREHAVWALEDAGYRVVIASSFADIFRSNCYKVGVLSVVLAQDEVAALTQLIKARPESEITIDLRTQIVNSEDFEAHFEIEPFAKSRLLGGLDEVGLALECEGEIAAFEAVIRPWTGM